MENQHKKVLIVGIVMVLIFGTVLFIAQWFDSSNEENLRGQEMPQQKPSPMSSTNQQKESSPLVEVGGNLEEISTADWRTYSDKRYGYSIRYPKEWISDFIDGTSFYIPGLEKYRRQYDVADIVMNDINKEGDYFVSISASPNPEGMTLEEWGKYHGIGGYALIQGQKATTTTRKEQNGLAGMTTYYVIDDVKKTRYEITIYFKGDSNSIGEKIVSSLIFPK